MRNIILWNVAAVFLVHVALEWSWIRSMALVGLLMLCVLGVLRPLLELLRRKPDDDDGDDGGGPEKYPDGALLLESPTASKPEWRA